MLPKKLQQCRLEVAALSSAFLSWKGDRVTTTRYRGPPGAQRLSNGLTSPILHSPKRISLWATSRSLTNQAFSRSQRMWRPSRLLAFPRLNIEWLAPQSGEAGLAQQNGPFFCLSSPGRLQVLSLGCQGPQRLLPPLHLPGEDFGQLRTTAGQGIPFANPVEGDPHYDLILCNGHQALWLNLSGLHPSRYRLGSLWPHHCTDGATMRMRRMRPSGYDFPGWRFHARCPLHVCRQQQTPSMAE